MKMKETGLVRRIDDLGRIQIPKVIRNQMFGLEEWNSWGVPFEFFIDGDSIVIKRYKENEDE
jgi:bifunctional DNA-binding transcriptional regulator/antitoxin component of YhaV-PrlF toxin-antitoxin module